MSDDWSPGKYKTPGTQVPTPPGYHRALAHEVTKQVISFANQVLKVVNPDKLPQSKLIGKRVPGVVEGAPVLAQIEWHFDNHPARPDQGLGPMEGDPFYHMGVSLYIPDAVDQITGENRPPTSDLRRTTSDYRNKFLPIADSRKLSANMKNFLRDYVGGDDDYSTDRNRYSAFNRKVRNLSIGNAAQWGASAPTAPAAPTRAGARPSAPAAPTRAMPAAPTRAMPAAASLGSRLQAPAPPSLTRLAAPSAPIIRPAPPPPQLSLGPDRRSAFSHPLHHTHGHPDDWRNRAPGSGLQSPSSWAMQRQAQMSSMNDPSSITPDASYAPSYAPSMAPPSPTPDLRMPDSVSQSMPDATSLPLFLPPQGNDQTDLSLDSEINDEDLSNPADSESDVQIAADFGAGKRRSGTRRAPRPPTSDSRSATASSLGGLGSSSLGSSSQHHHHKHKSQQDQQQQQDPGSGGGSPSGGGSSGGGDSGGSQQSQGGGGGGNGGGYSDDDDSGDNFEGDNSYQHSALSYQPEYVEPLAGSLGFNCSVTPGMGARRFG